MQKKKQQLELDVEQWTGLILGKECIKAVYAGYIMWNARLDEAQTGIKLAGRNMNNLIQVDDTTLMAESKEETKEPLDEGERGVKKLA